MLLPSGVNIVPGQRPIHASGYRDLSMSQVGFLGTLLSALRPDIDILFQKELYDAFLRNSPDVFKSKIGQKSGFTASYWI
jgi:hypothetical protein